MESLITKIATTPIIINEKNNELTQVLNKILEWIELIMEYGELCEQKFVYKDVDITNDSDFTLEMRIASLGREYKKWKIYNK